MKRSKRLATIGILAAGCLHLQELRAAAGGANAERAGPFLDYHLADAELKVVGIDSDPTESFLALQFDIAGRLFAGGREGLFVYEPAKGQLFQPRQLLYRFPKNSWIYGIAIRGVDLYVATHTAVYVLEGAVLKRKDLRPKRLLCWADYGASGKCLHMTGDIIVGGELLRHKHCV